MTEDEKIRATITEIIDANDTTTIVKVSLIMLALKQSFLEGYLTGAKKGIERAVEEVNKAVQL